MTTDDLELTDIRSLLRQIQAHAFTVYRDHDKQVGTHLMELSDDISERLIAILKRDGNGHLGGRESA